LTSTDSEGHESSPAAATNGVKFESNGHLENDFDEVNIDETNVEESADSDRFVFYLFFKRIYEVLNNNKILRILNIIFDV
jgi:hypothetical protein